MRILVLLLSLLLVGCAPTIDPNPDQPNTVFEMGDEAPDLVGIEWLDDGTTERPNHRTTKPLNDRATEITLESLEGKVVLLNFWSYDCGFCGQVIRWINAWYEQYHDQGLEVVGIHTPEFAYERKRSNVEKKAESFGIQYPVGLDNDYATWKAYHNKYRPAVYLIDREGKLQILRYGTGYKDEIKQKIEELLSE